MVDTSLGSEDQDQTEYTFDDVHDNAVYDAATDSAVTEDAAIPPPSSPSDFGNNFTVPSFGKKTKKNLALIVLGALLAILIIYKVISLLFGSFFHQTTQQAKPSTMPSIPTFVQSAPKTTTPAAAPTSAQTKPAIDEDAMRVKSEVMATKKIQDTLDQQQMANQKQMNLLQDSLSDLQNSVGQLQGTVNTLSSQMKKDQANKKTMAAMQAKMNAARQKTLQFEKRYFVEAVIPGRAWLSAADGSAMTIAVGDNVPGYGKVLNIDAYSGTVKTSSGTNIQYGIND